MTMNHPDGRLIQRLSLYDDVCCHVLSRAYEHAKRLESDADRKRQELYGNNRVPVIPATTNIIGSSSSSYPSVIPLDSTDDDDDDYDDEDDDDKVDKQDDSSLKSSSSSDRDDDGSQSDSEGEDANRLATLNENEEEEGLDNVTDKNESHDDSKNEQNIAMKKKKKKKTKTPSNKQQRRQADTIQKQSSILTRVGFEVPPETLDEIGNNGHHQHPGLGQDESLMVFPPTSLLSREESQVGSSTVTRSCALMTLSQHLSSTDSVGKATSGGKKRPFIVCLLLQSGRFAGGVFEHGKCVAHRTSTHYTVRKGQGKAQSSQDGTRRPKSMGSQLRRQGEQSTKEDVQSTLKEWKSQHPYIDEAALILISCPKTMQSVLFFNHNDHTDKSKSSSSSSNVVLSKDDIRIRKVPFDVGRPTFENVQVVVSVMTTVDVCGVPVSSVDKGSSKDSQDAPSRKADTRVSESDGDGTNKNTTLTSTAVDNTDGLKKPEIEDIPLTPLHAAAEGGNLEALLDLLKNIDTADETEHEKREENGYDPINQPAGCDMLSPLHYAAASTSNVDPVKAAACVSAILIQGTSADPTQKDARGRVPYFLASHDKVREAFRKARAILGEDYCDWDRGAKVGPPLTEDDLTARKEKEAEKKRRKKAKQKEKKAKERAQAQEMEERRKKEEEERRKAEEAKRIRDGLDPRPTGGNVCDYCQKECKGKRRNQMYQRLEYKYCSVDCVNNHKRELMARAAMARFGN